MAQNTAYKIPNLVIMFKSKLVRINFKKNCSGSNFNNISPFYGLQSTSSFISLVCYKNWVKKLWFYFVKNIHYTYTIFAIKLFYQGCF